MKYIYIILLSACTFAACKNNSKGTEESETKSTNSEQSEATTPTEENSSSEQMNPMEAFAGSWTQDPAKETEAKSKLSLAKMNLQLNADGTYEGTSSMMNTNDEVKGTWTLSGNTVKLDWNGIALSLEADGSKNTLTDESNGVELTK